MNKNNDLELMWLQTENDTKLSITIVAALRGRKKRFYHLLL